MLLGSGRRRRGEGLRLSLVLNVFRWLCIWPVGSFCEGFDVYEGFEKLVDILKDVEEGK